MSDSRRFKVTTGAGRVYYVYGPTVERARRTFGESAECSGGHFGIEEDTGDWRTTLQDGRTVFGG